MYTCLQYEAEKSSTGGLRRGTQCRKECCSVAVRREGAPGPQRAPHVHKAESPTLPFFKSLSLFACLLFPPLPLRSTHIHPLVPTLLLHLPCSHLLRQSGPEQSTLISASTSSQSSLITASFHSLCLHDTLLSATMLNSRTRRGLNSLRRCFLSPLSSFDPASIMSAPIRRLASHQHVTQFFSLSLEKCSGQVRSLAVAAVRNPILC